MSLRAGAALLLTGGSPSQTVAISISSESMIYSPLGGLPEFDGFELNATPSQLNGTYSAPLFLNYSVRGLAPWFVTSAPFTFVYQRDSSGDGLTDAEKEDGWTVTTVSAFGYDSSEVVTSSPADYSTNGLVGDFVEKEYGLNPNTVDTSGSHMLDTWNLTFDLGAVGSSSPKLPSAGFEFWYDNGSYSPFTSGSLPSSRLDRSNISANPTAGVRSGDGSPWAASVLWSVQALSTFENLSGVKAAGWLRAVTGSYTGAHGTNRTITVWGKLSWGANPLSVSTPGDGIADGSRINPVTVDALELLTIA